MVLTDQIIVSKKVRGAQGVKSHMTNARDLSSHCEPG